MKTKVFIDGREGTTGLRIEERLENREDIELLSIDPDKRKDANERQKFLNAADLVFLCLPDAAAKEAVSLIENPNTRVIDASTAHRTAPGWAYGFPELSSEHRAAIAHGKRVANPGCHATGFISLAYPLVQKGILPAYYPVCAFSLTGYSGGGKKMIAEYEGENRSTELDAPREYGLNQQHKHLKEMTAITGLVKEPLFTPIVADYYSGMIVTLPLYGSMLRAGCTVEFLRDFFAEYYAGSKFIKVAPLGKEMGSRGFLSGNAASGWDGLEIYVTGNDERIQLNARFDNLGKGASGAAVQCMNIMMGCPEETGLHLEIKENDR